MIKLPYPDHVILFGGSPLMVEVAKMLRERGIILDIFTSPRQEQEPVGPSGETLGDMLTRAGMDWYIVCDDINTAFPTVLVTPKTLGIGLGEAWSFGAPILDAFQGRLLDFMGIPLPKYRGGAHYSWAIMNDEMEWGCCLQEVTSNTVQGEYDDGAIVWQERYDVSRAAFIPQHWFEACGAYELDFLSRFLDKLEANVSFSHSMPKEAESLFFPRLKTAEHGWVNWEWDGMEIGNFINAFDEPYPGASTTINGKTVQLHGVDLIGETFHPFAAGLIVRVTPSNVYVATRGWLLVVDLVTCDGKPINKELRCGMRFITSRERLERALTYRPTYTATGDKGSMKARDHVLTGKKVTLRTLTQAHCNERYLEWMNDPDVNRYLESRFQTQTLDSLRSFVRNVEHSESDYAFAIEENEGGTHIGNIKLGGINQHHKYCDVGYFVGQRGLWGKGLATEAIKLATNFAFTELGIYHIRAGVYEENVGSIKALRKAGYAFDGIWSGQLLDGNKRTGHAWLSTTSETWQGAV
jgi:RimJ/RimL family protein N-acetyltransferase/methionyl-tRNA formyltransferase